MKKTLKHTLALLLALTLLAGHVFALSPQEFDAALNDAAKYLCEAVPSPRCASTGGEWAVLGLARSGYAVPEGWFQGYYARLERHVKDCKGVLDERKYTEYSRVIVGLAAIGKDARDVAGYDLTRPLADYEKVVRQGLNGPVWALIALDSRNYPMPTDPAAASQATRQTYLDHILGKQLPDGGWNLLGQGDADPDVTGMALQALAKYQDRAEVKAATDKALACLSAMQDETGGFSSYGTGNSESCVQVLVALCELGISVDDPRFVKNGNSTLDKLLTFYEKGKGFRHIDGASGDDLMASEQGLYALAAVQRAQQGKNSLYRMGDAASIVSSSAPSAGTGLPGKNAAVQAVPVQEAGKTFPDISGHENQKAIEAMASRGIINGKGSGYVPDAGMTRAEYAKIVVGALGLTPKANDSFTDVAASAWYAPAVGTASDFGIITGVGNGKFNPEGPITRQEAAVMTARAARLCGLDTDMDASAVRNMLAQFPDYTRAADWARSSLACCYRDGVLDQNDLEIRPLAAVTRAEVAQMLYKLLDSAKLL